MKVPSSHPFRCEDRLQLSVGHIFKDAIGEHHGALHHAPLPLCPQRGARPECLDSLGYSSHRTAVHPHGNPSSKSLSDPGLYLGLDPDRLRREICLAPCRAINVAILMPMSPKPPERIYVPFLSSSSCLGFGGATGTTMSWLQSMTRMPAVSEVSNE